MGNMVRKHCRITDELPAEIREQVDRLLIEGGTTYDDIQTFLAEKGYDISRSAIGRYGKDFFAAYQRLKVIEDKSRALVSEAGDGMVLEEAASKIFTQMIIEAQLSKELDIKELPRIISDFAKLQASTVLRERFKADFRKKFDKVMSDAEKESKNMTKDELVSMIRERVYGLV
ncbi:MAG TPA: DUF3486 family protein [Thermodesulfobacteriota bacterium]|nr:DUF3486 family protein [Thermodesulfobacteriota bacterium]HNU70377.1 DUF3486 family protein [Thermodesulfobacteriota bacterium]